MNLYNLRYFVDSAKYKSMTKAAEVNHLSRPAVSQAIISLENELGVSLLIHQRRSFQLTQAGISLMKKAEPLLAQIEDLQRVIKDADAPMVGDFKLGSSRTLATFNLSSVINKLKIENPLVDFKIQLANSENLIEKLYNNEVDIIYFIGDEILPEHKQIVVHSGYFVLVEPKNKPKNLFFAITERRPETERLKILFERNFHKPLPVFAEVQSWDAIWNWVDQGVCGGLIPDFLVKKYMYEENFNLVLPRVFPYEIKVLFPNRKQDSKIIKSLIDALAT